MDDYIDVIPIKRIRKRFTKRKKDQCPKYFSYLLRAEKKKLLFELTQEQFNTIISQPCTYCGDIPAKGVDRIDSLEGYTIKNSTPCCTQCNMMKYTYSKEQFLRQVDKISKYLTKSPFL